MPTATLPTKAHVSAHNHEVLESWSRHLCEFLLNQERFLAHYSRRPKVETVFAMIKALCKTIRTVRTKIQGDLRKRR